MTHLPRFPRTISISRRAFVVGAFTVTLVATATLSPAGATASNPSPDSPVLATSINTAAGTWAAIPMGHLDQPLNTFWQLFFRSTGHTNWTDVTQSLATATNGGFLMSTSSGQILDIGLRPANRLTYSPIVSLPESGSAHATGLLPNALTSFPSALALDSRNGHSLALVKSGSGPEVLESTQTLFSWHTLTTQQSLAASVAGRACGLTKITAVGYDSGQALVGGDCRKPGKIGIFSLHANVWQLAALHLPQSLAESSINLVGYQRSALGTWALLNATSTSGTHFLAAWVTPNHHWSISPVLSMSSSMNISSFGSNSANGIFVNFAGPHGSVQADILAGPTFSWRQLPTLPAGTTTLAFGPANQIHALAVNVTAFEDWVLSPNSRRWIEGQKMTVPIEFGSSQ